MEVERSPGSGLPVGSAARDNGAVLGWPRLSRLIGDGNTSLVREWCGGSEAESGNKETAAGNKETQGTRVYESGDYESEFLSRGIWREQTIVFALARETRGRPENTGRPAADFLDVVDRLWREQLSHLPWEAVWEEWCRAYPKVRVPCGSPLPLDIADSTARVALPQSCGHFTSGMAALAKLSVALWDRGGVGQFTLSTRAAAKHMGIDGPSYAWRCLQALCGVGFLRCVDRGKSGKGGGAAKYTLDKLGLESRLLPPDGSTP